MIPAQFREIFFLLLRLRSSPAFHAYIHAYQGIAKPPYESFEVSCELIDGVKTDRMRMAILGLRRLDVKRWMTASKGEDPLLEGILYENNTEACFGIGLVDFSHGHGISRAKIFNEYGQRPSQSQKRMHVRKLFSMLNVYSAEFEKDLDRFKTIKLSSIDWDLQGQAMIKVYYGPFTPKAMHKKFPEMLHKDRNLDYHNLERNDLMPQAFEICARYGFHRPSLKVNMKCRRGRTVPYLKMFDEKREASKFFADIYSKIPALELTYICEEWDPVRKTQFYFDVLKA